MTDSTTAADAAAPQQVPEPVAIDPGDSLQLARLAADSARDADILERLHDVESPVEKESTELDLAAAFDINVARYADHPRVTYYLDFFQGPARERMNVWLQRLPVYEPMIRAALARHDLPGDLVYLALIESGYSNTAVSRSRAVGMWQFMRATGRMYGLRADSWVDERRDPIKATNAAARYLADLTSRLGSHYLAAAAYNGGPGRVIRGLRRIGGPALPDDDPDAEGIVEAVVLDDQFFRLSDTRYLKRETKDYVPKLIAAAMIAKQPDKYGFQPIPTAEPFAVDSVPVTDPISLKTVAKAAGVSLDTIVALNPHYTRGVTPPGRMAWVRVPPGHAVATTEAIAALPPSERVPMMQHVIRRGETLTSIGRRYGISASELSEMNGGISSRRLRVGARLVVPGRLTAASAASVSGSGATIHRVRRGETLGSIAEEYGVRVSQLRAWNGLGSSSLIRAGQRLRVRPGSSSRAAAAAARDARTYVVRRGDTLSSIARRYDVSVESLMKTNGIRSARSLKAGTTLTIRGG